MSCRNLSRGNFIEHELTDDEDSDSEGYTDEFRSHRGRRGGSVRSVSHRNKVNMMPNNQDFEENSESMSRTNRSTVRSSPRRGSINRSLGQPNQMQQLNLSSNRNKENLLHDRYERLSMKNVSDSPMTPDSESESTGRKALVQAKIREKIAQQSSLDESSSDFCKAPSNNTTNLIDQIDPLIEPSPQPVCNDETTINPTNQEDNLKNMEHVEVSLDDGLIGPPPSTPDQEWECQFCTFVNEPKTKICTICCKTPIVASKNIDLGQDSCNTIMVSEMASSPNESLPPQNSEKPKTLTKKSNSPTSRDSSSKDDSSSNGKTKGRNKKISFWPGTKPK